MTDATNNNETNTQATIASVMGEVVWLMSQSQRHRSHFFIGDLEWLIVPPISTGQFRIFKADGKPFGVAIWAFVSPEVEARLEKGMIKLKPDEWRSGQQPWLMDIVAPFGHADKALEDLQKTSLSENGFKCLKVNKDGKTEVVKYDGLPQASSEGA